MNIILLKLAPKIKECWTKHLQRFKVLSTKFSNLSMKKMSL